MSLNTSTARNASHSTLRHQEIFLYLVFPLIVCDEIISRSQKEKEKVDNQILLSLSRRKVSQSSHPAIIPRDKGEWCCLPHPHLSDCYHSNEREMAYILHHVLVQFIISLTPGQKPKAQI